MIKHFFQNKRSKNFIYSLICSKIVPEIINEYGGNAIKTKVGHSFIKELMRKNNSSLGTELSGHIYYKDNFYADSGIITSLIIYEIFSQNNKKFSELTKEFKKYHKTEEKSFTIKDKIFAMKKIESSYKKKSKKIIKKDGLTMEFDNFWFNLRPSQTGPKLRLNLEANDKKTMIREHKLLVEKIKKFK